MTGNSGGKTELPLWVVVILNCYRPISLCLILFGIALLFWSYIPFFLPAILIFLYELIRGKVKPRPKPLTKPTLAQLFGVIFLLVGLAVTWLFPVFLLHYWERGNLDALQTCIQMRLPVDFNVQFAGQDTPLHLFASRNNMDMVEFLLDHGANLEAQNRQGFTPLAFAVQGNHLKMTEYLLRRGADIHAKSSRGTVAHTAAEWGYVEMMKLLLKHGADINARGPSNRTVRENARFYQHGGVERFLQEKGASR
jgi:hypothetical protein